MGHHKTFKKYKGGSEKDPYKKAYNKGYDDGNCLTLSAKPIFYNNFGTIGECQITSGLRSKDCSEQGQCNCYCYNLQNHTNFISGYISKIFGESFK